MIDTKEFAGVTVRDCCAGCDADMCVITRMAVCGHPYKASHPGAPTEITARILQVKKLIAIQKAGGKTEENEPAPTPAPRRRKAVKRRRQPAQATPSIAPEP